MPFLESDDGINKIPTMHVAIPALLQLHSIGLMTIHTSLMKADNFSFMDPHCDFGHIALILLGALISAMTLCSVGLGI